MQLKITFGLLRVLTTGLIVAAVIGQFAKSLSMVPNPAAFIVNFFSFFTIQSNLIGAIVMAIAAVRIFRGTPTSTTFTTVRLCAAAYLTTTLVVYNTLLRNISLDQATTLPWSNEILHVWAPLLVLIDWVFAPDRERVEWQKLWVIAAYPIVWAVYTMTRGALVGWYPYPFLNPSIEPGVGYSGVTVYIVAIAAFILLMGAALIGISRFGRAAAAQRALR